MNSLSRTKWRYQLLAALTMIFLASGCQMLGMANPFSSGADSYQRATRAWDSNNPAEALSYAANAVYRDEKHWPAYRFIVANYDEAMGQINARLAELDQQEQSVEVVREKVRTLRDMMWFVRYVSDFPGDSTDPKIVESKNDSVAIPLTDYETPLAEAQAQGYAIAFSQASTLIAAGQVEEAVEALQVVTRDFVQGAEERAAAETAIAGFLVETATPLVARLTLENLDEATGLLAAARRFEETEEVAALTQELNSRAPALIFAEADRIARPGTVAAIESALGVAVQVRNYAGDDAEVSARLVSYAQRLADLYKRGVETSARTAGRTRQGNRAVEDQYTQLLAFLHAWPSVTGHETALEEFAAFTQSSRTMVHVVLDEGYGNARNGVVASLEAALANQSGKDIWVISKENQELAQTRQRVFQGHERGRWWSANSEQAEQIIYPDSSVRYLDAANGLTTASSLDEARALNIDFLVRITVETTVGNARSSQRQDVQSVSAYQKTDGSVHLDASTVDQWRAARAVADRTGDVGMEEYNRQLAEAEITELWHQESVTHTYQSFTAPVTVTYGIEVINVANGRSIHTSRFTHRDEQTSNEVLVGVRAAVPAIQQALQEQVRQAPAGFDPNPAPVVQAGFGQLNVAPAATAISRG